MKSKSSDISSYLKSTEMFLSAGNLERALQEAEKAVSGDPQNYFALSFKRNLLILLGKPFTEFEQAPPKPESPEEEAMLARLEQLKRKADEIKRKGQLEKREKDLQKQEELRQKELEKQQQAEHQRFQELAKKQKEEHHQRQDEEIRKKEQARQEEERNKREEEIRLKKEQEERVAEQRRREEEKIRAEEERKRNEENKHRLEEERKQQEVERERQRIEEIERKAEEERQKVLHLEKERKEQERREKEGKERAINQLKNAANLADQGKFDLALAEITDALIHDPHNTKAKELNQRIRDAQERARKATAPKPIQKNEETPASQSDVTQRASEESSRTAVVLPTEEWIEQEHALDKDEDVQKESSTVQEKKSSMMMVWVAVGVIALGGIGYLVFNQSEPEVVQQPVKQIVAPETTRQAAPPPPPQPTLTPAAIEALYAQAKQSASRKEYKQAVESFQKVISLNPKKAEAYAALGKIELMFGMYDDAISHLTKASEFLPKDAGVAQQLALTYQIKGRSSDAVRLHETAMQLSSDPSDYLMGSFCDALLSDQSLTKYGTRLASEFEQALKKKPKDFSLRYRYGRFLQSMKKNAEAKTQFKKNVDVLLDVIQRETNNGLANVYLALTMTRQGHYPEAMGFVNDAQDIGKNKPEVLYKIAQIYALQMHPKSGDNLDMQKKQLSLAALRTSLALDIRVEELANYDFADLRIQPEFLEAVKVPLK